VPVSVSSGSLEPVGLKEALRELNKIDKKARLQVTKDYKEIVAPVIRDAQAMTPNSPPLSGMKYSWKPGGRAGVFPWQDNQSDKAMKAFVSGKKPRTYGQFTSGLATFGIRWNHPDALVVEMSGKGSAPTPRGQQMVRELNARFGPPGRFLWKAYVRNEQQVLNKVEQLIKDVMRQVQDGLR
jgi:hypothetical protein